MSEAPAARRDAPSERLLEAPLRRSEALLDRLMLALALAPRCGAGRDSPLTTILPAKDLKSGRSFEILLQLRDFQLDPSLNKIKQKLQSPIVYILDCVTRHGCA